VTFPMTPAAKQQALLGFLESWLHVIPYRTDVRFLCLGVNVIEL